MHIIAVIPAYEPDERMLPLLKEATEKGFDVIVVNDGSQERFDGVFEEAAQYAKVLGYRDNRGKGEALKHAFRYIEEKYEPPFAVVTMDSDGQHRLSDAQKLHPFPRLGALLGQLFQIALAGVPLLEIGAGFL